MDGALGVVSAEGQGGPLVEGVLNGLADGGAGPRAVNEPEHPLVSHHQGGAGACVASPSAGLQVGVFGLTLNVEESGDEVEGLLGEGGRFEERVEKNSGGRGPSRPCAGAPGRRRPR